MDRRRVREEGWLLTIESDRVRELRENSHVACDIVGRRRVVEALWVLDAKGCVVEAAEDLVQVCRVLQVFDLLRVLVQEAVILRVIVGALAAAGAATAA